MAGGAAGGILGVGTTKDMETGTERGRLGLWAGEVTGRAGTSCRGRQPEALLARLQRGASAVGVETWKVHLGVGSLRRLLAGLPWGEAMCCPGPAPQL